MGWLLISRGWPLISRGWLEKDGAACLLKDATEMFGQCTDLTEIVDSKMQSK